MSTVQRIKPLRVCVLVNRLDEVKARQTTAMLMGALLRRRHRVSVAAVDQLGLCPSPASGSPVLRARAVRLPARLVTSAPHGTLAETTPVVNYLQTAAPTRVELTAGDVLWIRSNPGRDVARQAVHKTSLDIAAVAQSQGVAVLNDPTHLARLASKVTLFQLDPRYRPQMMISSCVDSICQYVQEVKQAIVKPAIGSRGEAVCLLDANKDGLRQQVQQAAAGGPVVVQQFVKWHAAGDVRVVVADGNLLVLGDTVAAIHRKPARGDFRGNLHRGGVAKPIQLSEGMRAAAEYGARFLASRHVWLGGVDLVGEKIIELNVFSTGGLFDAQRFTGIDFADLLIGQLEQKVGAQ